MFSGQEEAVRPGPRRSWQTEDPAVNVMGARRGCGYTCVESVVTALTVTVARRHHTRQGC